MFDPQSLTFSWPGISLAGLVPLIDGSEPACQPSEVSESRVCWKLDSGTFILEIEAAEPLKLRCRVEGYTASLASIGIRFAAATGVRRYLRNGYQSWDGSFFVAPGTSPGDGPPGKAPTLGFAMTALLAEGGGALVLGFTRHDRFQSQFRFGGTAETMTIDVETLLDRTGATEGEPLVLFENDDVEAALRHWSQIVAGESPITPRTQDRRITGWCSWYNHYAMIDDTVLRAELASCTAFRDSHDVPLDVFQIDDGFTPEMGDWLDTRPQFPLGMQPLLADIAAAGFTPGLWIAPFMVGNRSKLYAAHPDWVVQDIAGGPLVQMHFYGEFRWHKRSEEYYILDVTHPQAAAYIGEVFRIWTQDWGAGYFKTDFMLFGSEYGPDRAVWHDNGLSRIAVWRRMAAIIRENIGEALWLGCGCPLWASVGYVDAVRIGRDIGVTWHGEYSAESLLRDLATRNHANGVLWQADPDCILLRANFHDLNDVQIDSLARLGAAAGGVLMTSDTLAELPRERAALFARLLRESAKPCRFELGWGDHALVYRQGDRSSWGFNLRDEPAVLHGRLVGPYATERLP